MKKKKCFALLHCPHHQDTQIFTREGKNMLWTCTAQEVAKSQPRHTAGWGQSIGSQSLPASPTASKSAHHLPVYGKGSTEMMSFSSLKKKKRERKEIWLISQASPPLLIQTVLNFLFIRLLLLMPAFEQTEGSTHLSVIHTEMARSTKQNFSIHLNQGRNTTFSVHEELLCIFFLSPGSEPYLKRNITSWKKYFRMVTTKIPYSALQGGWIHSKPWNTTYSPDSSDQHPLLSLSSPNLKFGGKKTFVIH